LALSHLDSQKARTDCDYRGKGGEAHSCEYSATGYFGNEGSDSDFYLYATLHVTIPAWGKGPRKRAAASIKMSRGRRQGAKSRTKA
jgi:hypothetical protein